MGEGGGWRWATKTVKKPNGRDKNKWPWKCPMACSLFFCVRERYVREKSVRMVPQVCRTTTRPWVELHAAWSTLGPCAYVSLLFHDSVGLDACALGARAISTRSEFMFEQAGPSRIYLSETAFVFETLSAFLKNYTPNIVYMS